MRGNHFDFGKLPYKEKHFLAAFIYTIFLSIGMKDPTMGLHLAVKSKGSADPENRIKDFTSHDMVK